MAALSVLLSLVGACGDDGPDAEPGEAVGTEEVDLGGGNVGIRFRYGSVDVDGDRSEVTALAAVPAGPAPEGGWPVAAWAHATTGVSDECDPSERPDLAAVGPTLVQLVAAGYLAVATDYEGVGTDGGHPYLHGPSEARAVVDSVLAARALLPEGQVSASWAVLGHSQGGQAAAFAAELGPELAPELTLVGAVPIAMVAEPAALAPLPDSLVLLLSGYLATDGHADDDDFLTPEGRVAVRAANRTGCDVSGPPIEDPLVSQPEEPGFLAYLEAGIVGQQPAAAPVLVAQGDQDHLTQLDVTRRAVARWCDAGSTGELRIYPGADHGTVVEATWDDAMAWLQARFAGEPAAATCPPP